MDTPAVAAKINKIPTTGRKLLIGLIIGNVALVAVCAAGLYRVYQLSRTPRVTYIAPKIVADPVTAASPTPAGSDLRTYQSKKLGISFSYPATWDVAEGSDEVTVTSPDFTFTSPEYGEAPKPVVGNVIVAVGKFADTYAYNSGEVVANSVPVTQLIPSSKNKQRYLTYTGSKYGQQPLYFEALIDSGRTAYKNGQKITISNAGEGAAGAAMNAYGKYSIVAAYKSKTLICQSAPCRNTVAVTDALVDPVLAQAAEIMKTVSF